MSDQFTLVCPVLCDANIGFHKFVLKTFTGTETLGSRDQAVVFPGFPPRIQFPVQALYHMKIHHARA